MHSQPGTLSDALRHCQQELDRFREVGDLGSAGETLVDISQLQLRHGQLGAAIRDATEAAEISLRTGSRRNLGRALTVLGRALASRGRPDGARSHSLEAVASLEALDRTPEADLADGTADPIRVSADRAATVLTALMVTTLQSGSQAFGVGMVELLEDTKRLPP